MPELESKQSGNSSSSHNASLGTQGTAGAGPGKRTLVEQLGQGPPPSAQRVRVRNHRRIPGDADVEVVQTAGTRKQVLWQSQKFWVESKDVDEAASSSSSVPAPRPTVISMAELVGPQPPAHEAEPSATHVEASASTTQNAPALAPPQVSEPSHSSEATMSPATTSTQPAPTTAQPVPTTTQPAPTTTQPVATTTQPALAAASSSSSGAGGSIPGLHDVLSRIYAEHGGKPSANDFVEALRTFAGDDVEGLVNQPAFAWELMRLVGEVSGKRLHEQIKQAKGSRLHFSRAQVHGMPWTLRHYTTSKANGQVVEPTYKKLKSTVELEVSSIAKSKNTNDSDWAQIGNVGFSFYLLCVAGVAPTRSFLGTATHYAEFAFEAIPSLFVSGDMLGATSAKGEHKEPGLKGTGSQVKDALCSLSSIDRSNPAAFLAGLDSHFGNFEAKVPGQLIVTEWKAL